MRLFEWRWSWFGSERWEWMHSQFVLMPFYECLFLLRMRTYLLSLSICVISLIIRYLISFKDEHKKETWVDEINWKYVFSLNLANVQEKYARNAIWNEIWSTSSISFNWLSILLCTSYFSADVSKSLMNSHSHQTPIYWINESVWWVEKCSSQNRSSSIEYSLLYMVC